MSASREETSKGPKSHIKRETAALQEDEECIEIVDPTLKCRVCWEDKESTVCVIVTTKWAKDSPKTIKDVLLLCVPWMSVLSDDHLCKPCLWQLKFTYDFIERCLKTQNILNRQNNKGKISLEEILHNSIKNGNKIQIIFESPVNAQTYGAKVEKPEDLVSSPTDGVKGEESDDVVQISDDELENIDIKIHSVEVARPSEHDYCISKGTQIDVTHSKKEPVITTQNKTEDKYPTNEKEKMFDESDDNIGNDDDDDFVNDTSTNINQTEVANTPETSDPIILKSILGRQQTKRKHVRTTLKKYKPDPLQVPHVKNALTELLDIVPVELGFVTVYSEMTTEQQSDLVRDGINVLNMSKDPNKKKRTIFLSRNLWRGHYSCQRCNIAFLSRCDYLDHKLLHKRGKIPGGTVHTCTVCAETFSSDLDFRSHSKVFHGLGSPHFCSKCKRGFKTKRQLKAHQDTFKDQEKCVYKCPRCNKEFSHKSSLSQHEENVKDAPCCDYKKCNTCLKKFTKEDFKAHSAIHPAYLCPECGKSFAGSVNLFTHTKNVHRKENHMCDQCGQILGSTAALKSHLRGVHGDKIYMCDQCPLRFSAKFYLTRHQKRHKDTRVQCKECGKLYANEVVLRVHERQFHLGHKRFTCDICNEGFLRMDYLKRHVRRHEIYANNTCGICRRSFASDWRLEAHMFSGHDENGKSLEMVSTVRKPPRTGKKKYYYKGQRCVCKICNKVLMNVHCLRLHYKAHLKIRQERHKCEICNIIYQNKGSLNKHMALHKDPNFEFSCNICHAYTSSNIELEDHVRRVHNNMKYKCELCGEAFGRKFLLLSHETQVHQEEKRKKEAILQYLEKNKVFVPFDENMPRGNRKGGKLEKLEVDVDRLFKKIVNNEDDLNEEPGSSQDINPYINRELNKNFAENQTPWPYRRPKNVVVERGYSTRYEDERACRIIEEENRGFYMSYQE